MLMNFTDDRKRGGGLITSNGRKIFKSQFYKVLGFKQRTLFSENAYIHLYTDILHLPPYSHTQSLTAPRSYNYRLWTFKVALKGAITIKMASPVHSLNNAILSTYCTSKAVAWVMKELSKCTFSTIFLDSGCFYTICISTIRDKIHFTVAPQ